MARTFVRASSQYLERTSTPVAAQPLTMCAWVRPASFPATMTAFSLCHTTVASRYLAMGFLSSDKLFVEFDGTGGAADVTGTTVCSTNTWYHLLCTMDGVQLLGYLNGVTEGNVPGTGTQTSWTPNCIDIGALNSGGGRISFFDGMVAEFALYNALLSQDDITMLGLGMSPLLVKPSNLKAYAPLLGVPTTEPDYIVGTGYTVSGATVAANHPRIFVPRVGLQHRPRATSLASVSKTLTPSYNIIQQIQKTLSPSYNVKITITKNLASSYTVKKAITKTLSPSYNVVGHVNKTLTPSYSVRQQISKALTTSYGLAGGITKSLTTSYNIAPRSFTGLRIRSVVTAINAAGSQSATSAAVGPVDGIFSVAKSLSTTYFIKIAASKTLTTSYNIRVIVTKALSASYIKRVFVSKALAATYNVNTQLTKSLNAVYNVVVDGVRGLLSFYVSPLVQPVAKSLTGTYTVRVLVAKTVSASYTVRGAVVRSLAASYTVKRLVQKTLTNTYTLAGKILKTLSATYIVKTLVTSSLVASSTIKTLVSKNLTTSYTIVQRISKALVASYVVSVTGTVQKALTATYNLRATTAKALVVTYFLRSTVPSKSLTTNYILKQQIAKNLSASYIKQNVLVVNLTTSYNVIQRVPKTLTSTYGIGGIITKNLPVIYSIGNTASKTLSSSYIVKNLVTQSFSANYGVTGRVSSVLFVNYNIFRSPITVGQHGSLTLRTLPSVYLTMRQFKMTDIGDVEILQIEARDRYGNLTDPTNINGWVMTENGTITQVNFVQSVDENNDPILGFWEAPYEIVEPGNVTWRVETAGNIVAAGERHFKVKPQKVVHV